MAEVLETPTVKNAKSLIPDVATALTSFPQREAVRLVVPEDISRRRPEDEDQHDTITWGD